MSGDAHQDGTRGARLLRPLLPALPVAAALSCSSWEQPRGLSGILLPLPGARWGPRTKWSPSVQVGYKQHGPEEASVGWHWALAWGLLSPKGTLWAPTFPKASVA